MSDLAEAMPDEGTRSRLSWAVRGARRAFSLPALFLASGFIGFSGLAREAGLDVTQTAFMTLVVWALPAQVVLIGAIQSGIGLPAAALAVGLSSVRLMPMVVAILPDLRARDTRNWTLYLLAHFVAVTSWVLALQSFATVPRAMRTAYYAGLGIMLAIINTTVVVVMFLAAPTLPPIASAALLLLTPMYFLTSMWSSARGRSAQGALVAGMALGPLFHVWMPGFDLLAAGLVGGVGAYAHDRWTRRRLTVESA